MYRTMNCSLCADTKLEGTLLTREQIEEISDRIVGHASEMIREQLEKAISLSKSDDNK